MTTKQLKQLFADLELNRSYFARKLRISAGTFNNKLSNRINNGGRAKIKSIHAFSDLELDAIKVELRRMGTTILNAAK